PGDMPSGFTLLSNLADASLAPGEKTYFVLRLDAAAAGTFTGTIHLANTATNSNPFDLTITGGVTPPPAPEIDLTLDDQSIDDGGRLNFGSTIQGDGVS